MGLTLVEKIIKNHTNEELIRGSQIHIKIDQTLTQDATGTMAYLEFVSMGIPHVKTELSVSYVDHNTLQNGFMNMDDHLFLQSVADKYGIIFSKPGNGICHQVHLERFARPGKTLLGSDSHTPTSSAMGMLAIGAGGLDVALAMAGIPFTMIMPHIIGVNLTGKLRSGVSAKDVILKLLEILTVKGGVNKVVEYFGPGVQTLSVTERATITNMGAELGATSSVFPSDERTKEFLKYQKREEDFIPLSADSDCKYDQIIDINLSDLEPLIACPSQPDQVKKVSEIEGMKIHQVLIGSCTNSSYDDLAHVAAIFKGHHIDPHVSCAIAPGSKSVLRMITKTGILDTFLEAGCRILESACGPCIGMGQSPNTDAVTLRTFNRNFYGRSGTTSAGIYLVSPEVAAISAIKGVISNPIGLDLSGFDKPSEVIFDENLLIKPTFKSDIIMGPNIKPLPKFDALSNKFEVSVSLKVSDNISTDHIMPAGANVLPYRSNIERISDFCFYQIDPEFKKRCLSLGKSIIVAGENYGQGSSREHAAIAPRYLGVKAILAKSFARIHKKNLINFGILPLECDASSFDMLDNIEFNVDLDNNKIIVNNLTKGMSKTIDTSFTDEEKKVLKMGGLLNTIE